jgi:hypothetical protein
MVNRVAARESADCRNLPEPFAWSTASRCQCAVGSTA